MATLREIKRRIDSVKSTQQITKAMKMVAAAKLRKAQKQLYDTRPFSDELFDIISRIFSLPSGKDHPYFEQRKPNKTCYVLITADRGLCGGFNSNLIRAARKSLLKSKVKNPRLLTIGKKGYDFFRKSDIRVAGKYTEFFGKLSLQDAIKITGALIEKFEKKQLDRIYIVYNEFLSVAHQDITVSQFLPIIPKEQAEEPATAMLEPHPHKILQQLVPMTLQYQMFRMLLESYTAEQSARMTAMETAAENADEMIKKLVLYYNKARQAAITTELTEIVSGVEAFKG